MSIKKFINNSDINIVVMSVIFGAVIILSTFENVYINAFGVLYCLVYFGYFFYIFCKDMINVYRNEPFGFFIYFLAILFIVIPILIYRITDKNKSTDMINSFYTISVGIGINYVIDSTFKYIEPKIKDRKKKLLTKKGEFTKILFNVIYISEYTAFILVEHNPWSLFAPLKEWKDVEYLFKKIDALQIEIKVLLLTMFCFIVLMVFISGIMNLILKELNIEVPDQTSVIKENIENELKQVSEIKCIIENNNVDILKNMEDIESKLYGELMKLDNLDSEV